MKLSEIISHSYVPCSHQPHVAMVRSRDGRIFGGVRIENSSYPLTVSAVKTALFSCLSEDGEPVELEATTPKDSLMSFWEKEFELSVKKLKPQNLPDEKVFDVCIKPTTDIHAVLNSLVDHKLASESNFPVAAVVETEKGYFGGQNIECSAWEMGLCAEQLALFKAITYGCNTFKGLYIHAQKGEFCSPCGACRQVFIEHMRSQQVHLYHSDNSTSVHYINDLIPYNFFTSTLKNN